MLPTGTTDLLDAMRRRMGRTGGAKIADYAPDNPNAPTLSSQPSSTRQVMSPGPTVDYQNPPVGTRQQQFETSHLPYNTQIYNTQNQLTPSIGAPTRDNLANMPSKTAGWESQYADPVNLLDWGYRPRHEVDVLQQAKDLATLEYNPLRRALEGSMAQADIDYNAGQTSLNKFAELVDPRLAAVSESLQQMLGEGGQANQQSFQDAIQAIQQSYGQAGGANENLYDTLMARITGDAERLGTEAGLTEGTAGLTRDYAFNQMLGQNALAGRTGNMEQLASHIGALDTQRQQNAGLEYGQRRSDLQTQLFNQLGQLGAQYGEERAGLRNQLTGLEEDRGAAIRSAFENLTQQQFENRQTARGSALQEFMNQLEFGRGNFESDRAYGLAREQFGLEAELGRGGLELDKFLGTQGLAIEKQKLSQDAQRLQAELAQITDPIERQYKQAQIDKIYADINAMGGGSGTYESGFIGLDEYIADRGINRAEVDHAKLIIGDANNNATEMGAPELALPIAQQLVRERFGSSGAAETINELLQVYYFGTGGAG